MYFFIGILGLTATISIPIVIQRFSRRWTYTAGACMVAACAAALWTYTLPGQAAGMLFRVLGAGMLSVATSLYIMDYIPKTGLVRSESLRMTLAAIPWTICPYLGVRLYVTFGMASAYLWSGGWALLLIVVFWFFRLTDRISPNRLPPRPTNPLRSIRRFIQQPRMRLAWLVAFGRSCYWGTFYVYGPILMVSTGQGAKAGGLIVSISNALLITGVLWGRLGTRFGVRRVVVGCFLLAAICGCLAGVAGEAHPWTAALILLVGVLSAVALDAVGSTPFLRAVHPYERPQMTAVYRTNLDISDLLPALLYSVILGFTGLGGVFFALGLFSLFCAYMSWRHLPRSM